MDVRCEKCLTEYELDEARLKPGGVTVKCTNCGHMFKIRKRSTTNAGAGVPGRAASPSGPQQPRAMTANDPMAPAPDGGDREWRIRLETGETRSCRELATLQQWIVAGVVTRESLISRTGKTWKRLGDISELGSYFAIADEARGQRQQRTDGRAPAAPAKPPSAAEIKSTLIGMGPGKDDIVSHPALPTPGPVPEAVVPSSPRTPPMGSNVTPQRSAGPSGSSGAVRPPDGARVTSPEAIAATMVGGGEDGPTNPRPLNIPGASAGGALLKPVSIAGARVVPSPTPPPIPRAAVSSPPPPGDRMTGEWAASDLRPVAEVGGPQGPTAGKVAAIPAEPAFAGRLRNIPATGQREPGFGSPDMLLDDDLTGPVRVPGAGTGKWIALGALLLIAGAGAAIYFLVIRPDDGATGEQVAQVDALSIVPIATATDAALPPRPDAAAAVTAGDAFEAARSALYSDVRDRASQADLALAGKGDDAEVLAMRARLATTLAQSLEDEARLTPDRVKADSMRKQKTTTVLDAVKLASRAVQKAPASPLANAAMADLLRLQGKPAKDIKKYLDAAGPAGAGDREVALVTAMLDLREKRVAEARAGFARLDAEPGQPGSMEQTGDVRPRFQAALLHVADGKLDAARAAVEAILTLQPDHAGARALQAKLASAVSTTDPMPPEDGGGSAAAGGGGKDGGGKDGGGKDGGDTGGDSYDRVLAKANAAAENSCAQAMPLYEKALDLKPNSVEALTGVGYCHLDAKQFSQAYSKFRAALGISSRYERALWGVAEMYQQQGRNEQAIEAYRRYLEVYPGNQAAKKQIERMGGTVEPPTDKPPTDKPPDPGPDKPADPPPEKPPDPPADKPSDSGSAPAPSTPTPTP
jgi:predicted Zn finger-like uncharacterized protein